MTTRKKVFMILRIVALFFGVAIVAGIIAISRLDLESFRTGIIGALSRATGLVISVDGHMSWEFGLTPKIIINDVHIANAEWADAPNAVSIKQVAADVNLARLVFGQLEIQSLDLENVTVNLEKNSDGEWSAERLESDNSDNSDNSDSSDNSEIDEYPWDFNPGIESLSIENLDAKIGNRQIVANKIEMRHRRAGGKIEYLIALENGERYWAKISTGALDGKRKIYPVRVEFVSDDFTANADIAIEQTSRLPIDFVFSARAPDIARFAHTVGFELPKLASLDIRATGGMEHTKLKLNSFSAKTLRSDISMTGDIDWSRDTPHINADIKSKNFILADIFPTMYDGKSKPWKRPNRELNVFHNVPLHSDILNKLHGKIKLDFANLVTYRDLNVTDIKSDIDISNGSADVHFKAGIADGIVRARLKATEKGGELFARGGGIGTNVTAGVILREIGYRNILTGLPGDFHFYLQSRGRNLSQFMGNLNGRAAAWSVAGGTGMSDVSSVIMGRDFLVSVQDTLEKAVSRKKPETTPVHCYVVNLAFRDGRTETKNGIALETAQVNMFGGGFVDLGREELEASITTVPARGLKVRLEGDMIGTIEFRGNMAEPEIRLNGDALTKKAITATWVGLAVGALTGGLGLVAGAGVGLIGGDLLTNWAADDHPCRTAKERGAPSMEDDPEYMVRPLGTVVDEFLK